MKKYVILEHKIGMILFNEETYFLVPKKDYEKDKERLNKMYNKVQEGTKRKLRKGWKL